MRTLSTATGSAVGQPITQPVYLIELGFSTTLRLSTRGDVAWSGYTWQATGAAVESLRPGRAGAAATARVSLANADQSVSALVLGEGVTDKTARIWQVYGPGPHAVEDAVQVFGGVMDAAPEIGLRVVLDCTGSDQATAYAPRLYCAPPVFNHLPPAGTVISWAGERYELERR